MEDASSLNLIQCRNAGLWLKASQSALVINADFAMNSTILLTDVEVTRQDYEKFKDNLAYMAPSTSTVSSFSRTTDLLQLEISV